MNTSKKFKNGRGQFFISRTEHPQNQCRDYKVYRTSSIISHRLLTHHSQQKFLTFSELVPMMLVGGVTLGFER
jgi:hypothetical protein